MIRSIIVAVLAVCSLTCLPVPNGRSQAMTFSSGNTSDAGTWNTVYAQGFSPSLEATPDPVVAASDLVTLDAFEFYKSGTPDMAADIKLAIVDNLYYDYNVPLTTSSPALLGLSSNTIANTGTIATGNPIAFNFAGVSLAYGDDYAAVFVNDDGSGGLSPVLVSALTENYIESPPGSGTFVPVSNYGADDQFQYATSNFINNGFFSAFSFAGDAGFNATFTAVPEPNSLLLLCLSLWGCVACTRSRRRQS